MTRASPPPTPRSVAGTPASELLPARWQPGRRNAHQHPGRALAEELGVARYPAHAAPGPTFHHHFRQGHAEPTIGDVVDAVHQPFVHQSGHQSQQPGVERQVEGGQVAPQVAAAFGRPPAARQRDGAGAVRAEEHHPAAQGQKPGSARRPQAVDQPEHPDDRRRVDIGAVALVVKAHVAAYDGDAERQCTPRPCRRSPPRAATSPRGAPGCRS